MICLVGFLFLFIIADGFKTFIVKNGAPIMQWLDLFFSVSIIDKYGALISALSLGKN